MNRRKILFHKKQRLRIPIWDWGREHDAGALSQAVNITKLPFARHHVSLMADRHQGYGMPIGGVAAFDNVIMPNAVGVDIGCSMTAVRTSLKGMLADRIKQIFSNVREMIPIGKNHHKTPQYWDGFEDAPDIPIIQDNLSSARKQLGTLGGGNHFIEIQQANDGHIWFMIHSGSRNIGYRVAEFYHKAAIEQCNKWHIKLPHKDLAYLPAASDMGKEYIEAMQYMLKFSRESHRQMARSVSQAFNLAFGHHIHLLNTIYVKHNYAALENHYGLNLWVHRKGAIRMRRGDVGIIPGDQGRKSYIVEGKENKFQRIAFYSAPHGAGRIMGREQAKRELNLADEVKFLEDQGIVHTLRNQQNLDEASGSYKNIKNVVNAHNRQMKRLVVLTPLGAIKDPSSRKKRYGKKSVKPELANRKRVVHIDDISPLY